MNATQTVAEAAPSTNLHYLPVGLFGAVMGSIGLAVAWHLAADIFGVPAWIGGGLSTAALLVAVVVGTGYAVKACSTYRWPCPCSAGNHHCMA